MSTISRKSLAIVAMLALVYTTPALSASSHQEQSQQQLSEIHKSATSSAAEKSGSNVNQEYVAEDKPVVGWHDLPLVWVFGLALFGFVWMSNRNRV